MRNLIVFLAASLVSSTVLAQVTINGGVGYRYDSAVAGSTPAVTRDRIKGELIIGSKVNDKVNAVFGVRTGNFNSAFNDMGNNGNLQSFGINLAYFDYAAVPGVKVTFGKMNQPWATSSSLLFDKDIKPEGLAVSYSNKAGIFGSASSLKIAEGGASADVGVNSVQVGAKKEVFGVGLVGAIGYQDYANVGAQAYKIQQGIVSASKKVVGKQVGVFVETLKNSEAKTNGVATSYGVKVGNAVAPKEWDVTVVSQKVEANSQYSLWNDSDFAGGQGNYKGNAVLVNYVVAKGVKVTGKYFTADRNISAVTPEKYNRVHVDVNFVF